MMVSRIRTWVIGLMLLLCLGFSNMSRAAQNADIHMFGVFWGQFSQAVIEDRRETVTDLTQLPFLMDGIEHDRSAIFTGVFDAVYAGNAPLFQEDQARSRSRRILRRLRRIDLCARAGERELSVH